MSQTSSSPRALIVVVVLVLAAGTAPLLAQEPARSLRDAAAVAAASPGPVPAAATPASLTLNECVELALKNGHRRRAAASSTEAALARQGQARSSRYPGVTAGLNLTRFDENPDFLFPASVMSVPASTFQAPPVSLLLPTGAFGPGFPPADVPLTVPGATVAIPAQTMAVPAQDVELMGRTLLAATLKVFYPLYTGGLAGSRIAQARAGVEAARQEERKTELQVAYDVRRSYWGVVLARQLLEVGRDTLARMEATLQLTETVYQHGSGRVKKTDFLRSKAVVESIRSAVAELENQERTARLGLEASVEWDGGAPLQVADTALTFAPSDCAADAAVKTALDSSPDVARLHAGLDAARAGIGVARSGLLPKAGLFASAQRFVNSDDAGLLTPRNRAGWSVGFGVEVPVFDGFRTLNEVREARAALQVLQEQDALLRRSVALEAKTACSQAAKAAAQARATRDAYAAAAENRDLNVRAYQEELVETKDVVEAQLMEALLAAQHYRALFEGLEAQARLQLVTGAAAGPGR